jgi:hypothetical protein
MTQSSKRLAHGTEEKLREADVVRELSPVLDFGRVVITGRVCWLMQRL